MQIFTDPLEFQRHNERLRAGGTQIGLFATLGAIHRGHLSLVDRAVAENDVVVSSVFVNNLMFSTDAEYQAYPTDLDGDLAKLEAKGVAAVVTPSREAVYPPGFMTRVTAPGFEGLLESSRLPNMMTGIATICSKIYEWCQPHRWYFGEKDAEQIAMVRQLCTDLNWRCEIVGCPAVREDDGLPSSSRNLLLSTEERRSALAVTAAVKAAKAAFDAGERDSAALSKIGKDAVDSHGGATVEYVEVVERSTMATRPAAADGSLLVAAIKVGAVRLLDNHLLSTPLPQELA
jgi:pantoate--beta-alanine ligase